MLETLTAESFTPHIGTKFSTTVQGYDEVLTLDAVATGHPGGAAMRDPFRLSLSGRRTDLYINPGTVELHHDVLGVLAVDMSPAGKRPDGTYDYQVVFN